METIQVVLDAELLRAADRAARRAKQNRSALVRDALRRHLQNIENAAKEEMDREGYARQPYTRADSLLWEADAIWPEH